MASKQPPDKDDEPKSPTRGEAEILPFRAARKEPPTPKREPLFLAGSDNEPLSNRQLIGIGLFLIFLISSGVWLIDTLRDIGRMQDCAMQGRRNCGTVSVPGR